jgi:hypothetical protein
MEVLRPDSRSMIFLHAARKKLMGTYLKALLKRIEERYKYIYNSKKLIREKSHGRDNAQSRSPHTWD